MSEMKLVKAHWGFTHNGKLYELRTENLMGEVRLCFEDDEMGHWCSTIAKAVPENMTAWEVAVMIARTVTGAAPRSSLDALKDVR